MATSDFFSSRPMSFDALLKTSDISPAVQKHLVNVYATLSFGIATAAAGSLVHMSTGIGGQWAFFAGLGMLIWLMLTPRGDSKRLPLFAGFCGIQGLSLGPLLEIANFIDPAIVTTAFLGTTTVFACFSGAALLSKRRSFLYLGAVLGSALSWMVFLSFINMFMRMDALANLSLYGGLVLFSGYVVFDTQMIVEQASNGTADVVSDALGLFLDFVNIFVRLVVILAKNSKKNDRR